MPGVKSARWAGDHDVEANRKKLVEEMRNKKDMSAYYTCIISYTNPKHYTVMFEGRLNGIVTLNPSLKDGFAYDNYFIAEGTDKPLNEVENKNEFSHRRRAIDKFLEFLNKERVEVSINWD